MARNAALEGLDDLAQLENAAGSNAANLQRLEETVRPTGQPGKQAKFATPEALATAIGASFIMGPAGALVGLAQGILGKREQQSAINTYLEQSEALAKSREVIFSELERQSMAANPEDQDTINGLMSQVDYAAEIAKIDPARSDQIVADAYTKLNALQVKNEEQRIARDVDAAALARSITKEQNSNWMSLLDDYDAQTANYETVLKGANNAMEMISRGNPVDIVAALIQVNKALDPTSVVRPEEAKALGNVGTKIEEWTSLLEQWAGTGQAIGPGQQKDLMTLVTGIRDMATGFQMTTDIEFAKRADTLGLTPQHIAHFNKVKQLPRPEPGEIKERSGNKGNVLDILDNAVAPFTDQALIEGVKNVLGYDRYQPSTRDEQQARSSTRTRQRGVN